MIQGIDVSHHQDEIDWDAVKASGLVNFAYIRVGIADGTYSTWADSEFENNYEGAKRAGIPVGAYHVFEPAKDPTMQFGFFNDTVGKRFFELPVWLDVERSRTTELWGTVSYATTRARWVEYLAYFDEWGKRKSVVYTSKWKWQEIVQGWWFTIVKKEHVIDGHPLCVADYEPLAAPRLPSSWKHWMFWQTNIAPPGTIPGIDGAVDIDYFNGTAEEFLAFQNLPEDITDSEKLARLWAWAKRHDPEFLGG